MKANDLLEDEEIVIQNDVVILTNRRVIDNSPDKKKRKTLKEASYKDIATVQKVIGGRESRLKMGVQLSVLGLVVWIVSSLLRFLPSIVETILFIVGAVAVVVGVHFTVNSWARIKPHTTLIFLVPGSKELVVSFPGRNNPKADELLRLYSRKKRGF